MAEDGAKGHPGRSAAEGKTSMSGLADWLRGLRSAEGAPPLLRGLRLKFIALNMGLAAVVLAASFAAICYMDYRGDVDEVYRTLAQTVARAGERPRLVPDRGPLFFEGEGAPAAGADAAEGEGREGAAHQRTPEEEERNAAEGQATEGGEAMGSIGNLGDEAAPEDSFAPPEIGGAHGMGDNPLPVAVYYCEGGAAVQLTDHSSAAVPDQLLPRALAAATQEGDSQGYLAEAGLFFAKREGGAGVIVAFADGAAANAWQGLALSLAGIGLGALTLWLLLNLLLSRWALRPVEQAWTQQQQFIADASHELKTPLTVILANNAILRQRGGETVASQGQWIESTQVEAERMQALVSDMLDLARPASDGAAATDGSTATVDLSRLVEGEALTFEAVAFERELTWECTAAEGISVRGSATRLQRAVAVLLDNACKYTEAGGTVDVALRAEGGEAVLAVRNTGEPIEPDDLPHLFDRFYRADKARTRDGSPEGAPGGYGLGLAIAQDIARAHKGSITVTSTAAEGTTFTLRLPLG